MNLQKNNWMKKCIFVCLGCVWIYLLFGIWKLYLLGVNEKALYFEKDNNAITMRETHTNHDLSLFKLMLSMLIEETNSLCFD